MTDEAPCGLHEVSTQVQHKELRVTYRATPDLPDALVSWLEDQVGIRRCEIGSPWRKLTSLDQAVMLLVYLTKGDTFAQLATHFSVSTDTG